MRWILCSLLVFDLTLFGLPSNGQVVHGDATIAVLPDLNSLTVEANGGTIIQWDTFNIGLDENVVFSQVHRQNAVLNRVLEQESSQILGHLKANCPIYLINAKGVFVGSAALIETAGFLASTADISNDAFLQGNEIFLEDLGEGAIVNLGALHASLGDVYLIARTIENQGKIEAPNGTVAFATNEVAIRPHTKECVFIRLRSDPSSEERIDQLGTIQALAVDLKTRSPYEKAIRQTGTIEASQIEEANGRIYLVAENGGIAIDGSMIAQSGTIEVLGKNITLESGATLDVSGNQGGSLVIGTKEITESILVDTDASIFANGYESQGGNISVWAKGQNYFHGTIEAKALGTQGDGGFIEISALEEIWVSSHPDLRAKSGLDGTLLFDPGAVRIDHSMTSGMGGVFGDSYCSTQLGLGNLSLSTTTNGTTGAETLTVNGTADGGGAAVVTWSSSNTFTLTGARNVILNAGSSITATGAGGIVINGGLPTPISGTYPGIAVNGTVQTNSGAITLTGYGGDTGVGNEGILMTGSAVTTATGSITMTGTAGAATTNGITAITSANVTATSNTSSGIAMNSPNRLLVQNNSRIRTLGAGGPGLNPINIATGGVTITGGAAGGAVISTANGNIAINSSDSVLLNGGTVALATAQIAVGSPANTVAIQSVGLTLTSGSAADAFTRISSEGGLISIDGTAMASGDLILTAGSGDRTFARIITLTTSLTTSDEAIWIGQTHPLNNITITGGTGTGPIITPCNAEISASLGGNIRSTITGDYQLHGGSNPGLGTFDHTSALFGSAGGNVDLIGTNYSLIAGIGNSETSARIGSSGGDVNITSLNNGTITLMGSMGTSTNLQFRGALIGTGPGTVTISANGNFYCYGGSGNNSLSGLNIAAGTTGDIYCDIGDGDYLLVGGSGSGVTNDNSFAAIWNWAGGNITVLGHNYHLIGGTTATNFTSSAIFSNSGVASISITARNNGTITLEGAPGVVAGPDDASAQILIVGSGDINISADGDLSLLGGSENSGSYIYTNDGNIYCDIGTGDYHMTAGSSSTTYSDADISSNTGGSVTLLGRNYFLQGGTGNGFNEAYIYANDDTLSVTANHGGSISIQGGTKIQTSAYFYSGSADIQVSVDGNCSLVSGLGTAAQGSEASIQSDGTNVSIVLNGTPSSIVALTGGSTAAQKCYIKTTSATGSNPISIAGGSLLLNGSSTSGATTSSAFVETVLGDIAVNTSGNIALSGGSPMGAVAAIRSTTQGAITLNSQNLLVDAGTAIGTSGVWTSSGDISVTCAQNCQYSASSASAPAVLETFGSDLTLIAGGSISLTGFTTYSTPAPTGNLLLIAGQNISIGDLSQVIANGTADSSLIMVVDNDFPAPLGIGPGRFILDNGGTVSASTGTPVRIYTARRNQNSIQDLINGAPFIPGPFGVDTASEKWLIYYPFGTYGGGPFTIYYKEPTVTSIYKSIAANLGQLADLLPVLKTQRLPSIFPNYHFSLCNITKYQNCKKRKSSIFCKKDRRETQGEPNQIDKTCDPTFSPYGSFIFEDDVYWVGAEF